MCQFDTPGMLFTLDLILKKQQQHRAERGDPPKGLSLWGVWDYMRAPVLRSSGDGAGSEAFLYKPNAGQISAALFRISELRETLQIGTG